MSDRSAMLSCARTARPLHGSATQISATHARTRAAERMRLTILHALLLLTLSAPAAHAQNPASPPRDPFARGSWHFEPTAVAALEAWNYNISHEELYGLDQGVTYGL